MSAEDVAMDKLTAAPLPNQSRVNPYFARSPTAGGSHACLRIDPRKIRLADARPNSNRLIGAFHTAAYQDPSHMIRAVERT